MSAMGWSFHTAKVISGHGDNSARMSASLIGRSGSSAFRLSTTTVSMSLTGSRFSSDSAPRPLYGAFLVKKFLCSAAHHFPSSVSLFDLKVRSFVPMVKPHRDVFEHDGAAWAVGMTIRGEPAFGRVNRATTLYPVGPRT